MLQNCCKTREEKGVVRHLFARQAVIVRQRTHTVVKGRNGFRWLRNIRLRDKRPVVLKLFHTDPMRFESSNLRQLKRLTSLQVLLNV